MFEVVGSHGVARISRGRIEKFMFRCRHPARNTREADCLNGVDLIRSSERGGGSPIRRHYIKGQLRIYYKGLYRVRRMPGFRLAPLIERSRCAIDDVHSVLHEDEKFVSTVMLTSIEAGRHEEAWHLRKSGC